MLCSILLIYRSSATRKVKSVMQAQPISKKSTSAVKNWLSALKMVLPVKPLTHVN